jgi:hypothetical protein
MLKATGITDVSQVNVMAWAPRWARAELTTITGKSTIQILLGDRKRMKW